MNGTPGALVIGGGFLGGALARCLQANGTRVAVTVRTAERAALLARGEIGQPFVFDLAQAGADGDWDVVRAHFADVGSVNVFCLLPPGALAAPAARTRLRESLARLPVRRAVLTSSTGIYGEHGGARVSAETEVLPQTPREWLLAAIEEDWLRGAHHHVVRLAGLYGPGRVIGVAAVRAGESLPGTPDEFLNLIHVDDAVALLRALADAADPACVELGADGCPVRRGDYYAFLADCCSVTTPRFDGTARLHGGNKRCDPATTCQRLGWRPVHADYRVALRALLADITGG
jgi:nucleoside-diphosphate-sugar epimerase